MWRYFNPNPAGRIVGDCTVRALCAALDIGWDDAFDLLAHNARQMCDMPSADAVLGSVLRQRGYVRTIIPDSCPDCYTAEDFCRDFDRGIYVLAFEGGQHRGHVATVVDGDLFDSWDSSREIPAYMWTRARRD